MKIMKIMAELSAVAAKTPISIDYEHQTLLAATNGQAAPAAGWMTGFEWRPGQGLYAAVSWTPRAKAYIDAQEYRYISPVILYDEAGRVTGLHNAALVSTPAILGMDAVVAALAALAAPASPDLNPHPKAPHMELATLIALCGLAASSSAADVTAFIQGLMQRPVVPAALSAALGLQPAADEKAALAALTAKLGTPDAATLQVVAALQTQVATLSAQITDRQARLSFPPPLIPQSPTVATASRSLDQRCHQRIERPSAQYRHPENAGRVAQSAQAEQGHENHPRSA